MIHDRVRFLCSVCLIAAGAVTSLAAAAVSGGGPPLRIRSVPGLKGVPAGTPCAGISYDVNDTASGITVAPTGEQIGIVLQKFTPSNFPFRPTAVCVAVTSSVDSPAPYDVVIYSDASGAPGIRLATVPTTPAPPGTIPGTWMTTSVDGSIAAISGPFWAGIRYASPGVIVGDDEPGNPASVVAASNDDGATFLTVGTATLYIRAVGVDGGAGGQVVPALSGLGLASLAVALAAGGFLLLRKADI